MTNQKNRPNYITGNILVDLGLANLEEKKKLALLDKMDDLIHKRLLLRINSMLTDEQAAVLEKKADNSQAEQLAALSQFIPNLTELILTEVKSFKEEMLGMNLNALLD
ncbi:MAG: hypothetical protein A2233_00190 [Candidatus Kerfeldbacteria bacterium RIFOXYA2_FULL_38_24]|uniref:Uncharacterized protein n=1 Tax=Candidatus Kerfeldbacteria bacterium RIFOXYB2_FULL_38_14 TaxID=1798547 RepID=A0A1G2B9Z2_9BACT|nr:MAG: hypothetical protein A2233_00190 [Candidatus Kerfeldbacteria bacterium RIFOXYA2_FULL_38_24]OGY86014.1 MAG: hypothetical protein A2319_00395 [Candidatus Kerfeldbacteria bacterium RIFOXYB2_FULL_38_14]OGY90123.1 MAG: hypothetical protein A2458_03990 [Candidatus Kerfeldbacteria bacterium RIFOXYC2_FULL_38_9]